jgi:hypothetical protein
LGTDSWATPIAARGISGVEWRIFRMAGFPV